MNIRIKRAYEKLSRSDGRRVLVDRIWPRGITKEKGGIDRWMKEIAPSTGLRKWFGHDPARWTEFKKRYAKELAGQEDLVDELRRMAREKTLTLVFGARDEEHNNAVALREYLE
jgi:uncharacterized protein YeaO (DUF488 family)